MATTTVSIPATKTGDETNKIDTLLSSLTAEECAAVDALASHDLAVENDAEAQAVAQRVADDMHVLISYLVAQRDVDALEDLFRKVGFASLETALRVARARKNG